MGFTRADLFPRLDLNTSAGALEVSRESFPEFGNGDNDSDLFAISGDVFWEIDLFGRIRRATESERALLFATDDTRRAVTISLVAEVAAAYLGLRDLDRRLEIARRTLQSRAEYVDLARVRFKGGLTSEKDWRQAEAEYHRTASFVSQFERLVVEHTRNFELLAIGYQQHANRLRRLGLWHQARSQSEPQSCCTGPEPCCCHLRKSHPRT